MTETQYQSYVKCEGMIRETIHLLSVEKFAYRKSEVYLYYRDRLINSIEYKRQTKREQSTLCAILWFNYKMENVKITYVPIWKNKVYRNWEDYPQELRDYVMGSNSRRTIYMGIEREALDKGNYSLKDVQKHIDLWIKENEGDAVPWKHN
jgi:hypothetical protein